MSFRNLSLIFISLLLTSVLLLQWWSITRFTEDVSRQVGESAFEVSRTTAETLIFEKPKIEIRTLGFSSSTNQVSTEILNKAVSQIRQDVFIELSNEKIDDFILLNSDGSQYEIPIPRTGIHKALEQFSKNVLYSTLALLFLGVTLAVYFTHKIASPLKKLQAASIELGSGSLGTQIEKDNQWHSSEIETTIDSFNKMSKKIAVLQKQNESLQNKAHLAELAEISRGLAHTIRNPLNTLNLAIDQMQGEKNLEQQKKLNHLAKHQITRIDKWVRSLMDVMSDDNNLIHEVDLTEVIKLVITDLKLSNDKALTFNFNSASKPTIIKAVDPGIKSILQSLVSNAVEASPAKANIDIKIMSFESGFQIMIKDEGCGFSKEVLDKIFTPHNTNKTYGAGMGLYLAERVIRHKYNGSISIKNNVNKGCCVLITVNNRGLASE